MTTQLTVTTVNVCGNPRRPKPVVRRRMRRALGRAGATFGQEVAASTRWPRRRGSYSSLWHELAGAAGKDTAGGGHEVPISLPTSWELEGVEVVKVHDGRRLVSPARFIVVADAVVDGVRVALVNCHPVSKPRRGVPASSWRIARWNQYHDRLVELVDQLVAQGFTVIAGGDLNRRTVPTIHPRQRQLVRSGLDHLWIMPAAGVSVVGVHTHKIGRTLLMDHPILSATVELRVELV